MKSKNIILKTLPKIKRPPLRAIGIFLLVIFSIWLVWRIYITWGYKEVAGTYLVNGGSGYVVIKAGWFGHLRVTEGTFGHIFHAPYVKEKIKAEYKKGKLVLNYASSCVPGDDFDSTYDYYCYDQKIYAQASLVLTKTDSGTYDLQKIEAEGRVEDYHITWPFSYFLEECWDFLRGDSSFSDVIEYCPFFNNLLSKSGDNKGKNHTRFQAPFPQRQKQLSHRGR
ncbi:MAG: hypothetical protein ACOC54_04305 [Candidatus Sumerlaeota bacterium]